MWFLLRISKFAWCSFLNSVRLNCLDDPILTQYSFTFKVLHQLKSNTYCSCWESFLAGLNSGFSFIAQTFKSLFLGNGPNFFWFMSIYSLGTLLNHFEAISSQSRIEKFLTSCCVFVQIPIDINREKKFTGMTRMCTPLHFGQERERNQLCCSWITFFSPTTSSLETFEFVFALIPLDPKEGAR